MNVQEAVRKGRVEGLVAMRDKLAEDMDRAEPAVVAQVAARLQAVLKEIAELVVPEEKPKVNELAERRASRRAKAASAAPTAGRRVVGGTGGDRPR